MQSTSCKMPGWTNHKLESRLLGEISTTSDMQMIPFLMAESEKELKSLFEGERGEWKSWLKPQHSEQMASSPIISWQIDGGKVDAVTDFLFLGSKITVDSDFSHEIKRHVILGRKAMRNLDSVLKSRDITLLKKVCIVKAMVFSSSHVWMWELDHKEG